MQIIKLGTDATPGAVGYGLLHGWWNGRWGEIVYPKQPSLPTNYTYKLVKYQPQPFRYPGEDGVTTKVVTPKYDRFGQPI